MNQNKKASEKVNRVRECIIDKNPGSYAVQDLFYWDDFLKNWRLHFGLTEDADIYEYYDLDIVCCSPNIDPIINNVQEISKNLHQIIYKGGFGSTLKLDFSQPVPGFMDYEISNINDLAHFKFEDPHDNRRFTNTFSPTDQYFPIDSFEDQLEKYRDDFCIFGNICEARETVWRIIGIENELISIADEPEKIAGFAERAADFNIELGKIQLDNSNINGLIIYGDLAYSNGLLMSPETWRQVYKPALNKICIELKKFNKPLIYHTDGQYLEVLNDLIEIGIDATHPNEAKSGLDIVKLKKNIGNKITFFGNIDATILSRSIEDIEFEVEYKAKAIEYGGYLPGCDDVPASISPENYDYYIKSIRKRIQSINHHGIGNV